jgi:hypothetical protein
MDYTDYDNEALDLATASYEQVSALLQAAGRKMPTKPANDEVDTRAWDAAAYGYFTNLSDDPSHFGVMDAQGIAAAATDHANASWHEYLDEG